MSHRAALAVAAGGAAAQGGCYSYDVAIITRDTTIKESYGFTQRTVGAASVGDTFAVIGSRQYVTRCWVHTSAGWLYGAYVSGAASTSTEQSAQDGATRTTVQGGVVIRMKRYTPAPK